MENTRIEELLSLANSYLEKRDFDGAGNVFEQVLEEAPMNVPALAGKLFIEDGIAGFAEFNEKALAEKSINTNCATYKENKKGRDLEFFNLYDECVSLGRKIGERKAKIVPLEAAVSEEQDKYNNDDYKVTDYYINGNHPDEYMSRMQVITIAAGIIGVLGLISCIFLKFWGLIIPAIAIAVIIVAQKKMAEARKLGDTIYDLEGRRKHLNKAILAAKEPIDKLKQENKNDSDTITRNIIKMKALLKELALISDTQKAMENADVKKITSEDIAAIDDDADWFAHVCPSCAGRLVLDSITNFHICQSCGNRYDIDYFKDDETLQIANSSMEQKEFIAAGEMYDFILSKDPDNLHALLGKLLIDDQFAGIRDFNVSSLSKRKITSKCFLYKKDREGDKLELFSKYEDCIRIGQRIGVMNGNASELDAKIKATKKDLETIDAKLREIEEIEAEMKTTRFKYLNEFEQADKKRKVAERNRLEERRTYVIASIDSDVAELNQLKKDISDNANQISSNLKVMKAILRTVL